MHALALHLARGVQLARPGTSAPASNPSHRRSTLRPVAVAALALTLSVLWPLQAKAQDAPALPAPPVANSEIDAELFYQLLLGEMHLRNEEPGPAYSLVLDAARKTQREELYRRAVEIALQGRAGNAALSAARDWAAAHPRSDEPHRYVLQILLALNRPAEITQTLRTLIQLAPPERRADVIGAIPQTLARTSDKDAALQAARTALQPFLADPSTASAAWTSLGRMQLDQQNNADALASAKQAMAADSKAVMPAVLGLELMERDQPGAEALVRSFLERNGRDAQRPLHLGFIRALIDQRQYGPARQEIATVIQQDPTLADAWLLQGTLQFQERLYDAAQASLEQYLVLARELPADATRRGQTQAFLQLAQMAEQRKDYAAANAWLDRIEDGQDILSTQLRRAAMLARQGKVDEARALLRQQPERSPDDSRRKLLAEAQLLRDQGMHQAASEVYAEAVKRFPDDADLVYEQAMAAEKAGRPDEMERLLRELIARKPDYHHAYNALGYSLADRNVRLPEAKALIQQALRATPNDPFILDSLGWVEFRMGNLPEALRILQDAYRRRPDAEIAAHLGEVHWAKGQREDALKVWREGLLLNPENETLLSTLRRLNVKP